jgi:hypothetical protein
VLEQIRTPAKMRLVVDGTRWIELPGNLVLGKDESGSLGLWAWQSFGKIGDLYLAKVPDEDAHVQEIPFRDDWLIGASKLAALEIESRFNHLRGLSRQESEGYATWALECFRQMIRRHCDLRLMRKRVALIVELEPWIKETAFRLLRSHGQAHPLSIREYNLVIGHRQQFEELNQGAPQLAAFYGLYCVQWDFPTSGRATERLRSYLLDRGVQEKTWGRLLGGNTRWLYSLRQESSRGLQASCIKHLQAMDSGL